LPSLPSEIQKTISPERVINYKILQNEKMVIVLLILLFIFACSNDWTKKKAPPYRPWATAQEVR